MTEPLDPSLRPYVKALLDDMAVSIVHDEIETAACWIVVCSDPYGKKDSYHGPFVEPAEAIAWAEGWAVELNMGTDPESPDTFLQPWALTVRPVTKTDP